MVTPSSDPTTRTYAGLTEAYAVLNARLFAGRLPSCLITMQRRSRTYGYFAGRRFTTRDGVEVTDEIALNPTRFAECSTEETLAILVREMVNLQQEHFGTPSRPGYHNREWAGMMRAVGLIPTATGEPGGKQTGQQVAHCIEPGGRFAQACAELIEVRGFSVPYVELRDEAEREARERKAASKSKYTCPNCGRTPGRSRRPTSSAVCVWCRCQPKTDDAEGRLNSWQMVNTNAIPGVSAGGWFRTIPSPLTAGIPSDSHRIFYTDGDILQLVEAAHLSFDP